MWGLVRNANQGFENHITFWPFAHTKCMNVFKLVSEDAYDGKGESGRTLGSNTGS